jgi:hypothetical protein
MSRFDQALKREIKKRSETVNGTVISPPKLKKFNTGAAPVWVADVNINSTKPLRDVPIKAGANGSRFYADLNQVVLLRRNLMEKFQIIGPGDRAQTSAPVVKTYTIGNVTPITTANFGQTAVRRPFSFYQGDLPGTPDSGLWGTAGFPKIEIIDNATGLPI